MKLLLAICVFAVLVAQLCAQNSDTNPVPTTLPTTDPEPTTDNVTCRYEDREIAVGDSFTSDDGCSTCTCTEEGHLVCEDTALACVDPCSLPPDPGPCDAVIPSYYFNQDTETCERFVYGGCEGNDNRFSSLEQCLRRCDTDSICLLEPDSGPCEALIPQYFFNAISGQCERFVYGGCQGNDNRFSSVEQCLRRCDTDSICLLEPDSGPCEALGCLFFFNATSGRCEIFGYGGCQGNENRFNTLASCERSCGSRDSTCRDGTLPVACLVDPCEATDCPNHFLARCVPDYCGGCNARFYDCNGDEVTDTCEPSTEPPTCPPDQPQVFCIINPCDVTTCPAHPDARCVPDYCGGCNARFYNSDGDEVTDTCEPSTEPPTCPPDQPQFFCIINPCDVTTCPAHPDARCGPDYCGGCNARFYNSDGAEVTDTCEPPTCPPDQPQVFCFVDPCQFATCPNYPNARCVADYCGGCNALFFDSSGTDVTDRCHTINLPPTLNYTACPPPPTDSFGTCDEQCDACAEGQRCCSNGCGHRCTDTITLPYYEIPLECPSNLPGQVGVCIAECQANSDCDDDDELCCGNGCGRVCSGVPSTQPCIAVRDSIRSSITTDPILGVYIPQCNEDDGSFSPQQCHEAVCWCVNTQTGVPVSDPVGIGQDLRCPSCTVGDRVYYPGQSFRAEDGCNTCFCNDNGFAACTLIACVDTCSLSPDPGPCDAAILAYYYDRESEQCRQFTYGGCGGNRNKFETVGDCLRRCNKTSNCLLQPAGNPESCGGSRNVYYFFNTTSGQCQELILDEDCEGNERWFPTGLECLMTCDPDNVDNSCFGIACSMPLCDAIGQMLVSDDRHCCPYCAPVECRDDQFQCNDGTCIQGDFVCDELPDCSEREDEPQACDFIDSCGFQCDDGVCLPVSYECDRFPDCRGTEDEMRCTTPIPDTTIPSYDPPLSCPDSTNLLGTCDERCRTHSDCEDGELCCSNGCGHSCMQGESPSPLCPAIRDQVRNQSLVGAYVPQCEDDGSFSPIQCHASTGFCWCVHTQTGVPTSEPSRSPNCSACTYNGGTYFVGESFTAEDGCNTCLCTVEGVICTRIACAPVPCTVGDTEIRHGTTLTDECSRCMCQFGQLNCTRLACMASVEALRETIRVTMPFSGDFDVIVQTLEEFKREVERTLLRRYADSLGFDPSQIAEIEVRRGSVVVVVHLEELEEPTDGANVTILVSQMQTDYEGGSLIIRHNDEVLQPNGEFQSGPQEEEDEEEEGLLWWHGLIIGIAVAMVLVTGIVIVVVGVVYRTRQKKLGEEDHGLSSVNPVAQEDDSERYVGYRKSSEKVELGSPMDYEKPITAL